MISYKTYKKFLKNGELKRMLEKEKFISNKNEFQKGYDGFIVEIFRNKVGNKGRFFGIKVFETDENGGYTLNFKFDNVLFSETMDMVNILIKNLKKFDNAKNFNDAIKVYENIISSLKEEEVKQ